MRTRTLVGGVIGAIVLALLVGAALVGSSRSVDDYDQDSPEAAVQDYFDALIDERPADAYDLFSRRVAEQCRAPYLDTYSPPVSRVVLDDVEIDGTEATVTVRITETYGGGPFAGNESTFTERMHLVSEDGRWAFSQVPWPYPCPVDFFDDREPTVEEPESNGAENGEEGE